MSGGGDALNNWTERMQSDTTKALGYQQITSLAAATALTVPKGATRAIITAETQAVRWRDDGTDPTTAIGMPLAAGASFTYSAFNQATQALAPIKFIEQAASAKLNIAYYE